MIIVDSVGWIAYFSGGSLADRYEPYLLTTDGLLCPAIIIYEVCKRIELLVSRRASEVVAAQMQRARVAPLDATLAMAAARLSIAHRLPMADAIIYATALEYSAQVITSDAHLRGLPSIVYIPHPDVAAQN